MLSYETINSWVLIDYNNILLDYKSDIQGIIVGTILCIGREKYKS